MENQNIEKVLVLAIETDEYDIESSLEEISALCETAGAHVIAEVVQKRQSKDSKTYIGKGKLEEARTLCLGEGIDIVIVDDELSASQKRAIEQVVDVPVIDRTTLILDIFARHATTAEGNLQVELAQQRYRLVHLSGQGLELSRLGGGIGTRGPGETKLESDKRHIRRRINTLEKRLEELEKRRNLTRKRRKKENVPIVSLVGYTNVGKSSLLNKLTGSDVLAENKLFATLDTTTRKLSVGDLQQIVMVDTVGFVSRLPHELVEAFKSTLEEVAQSDLILLVADGSSKDFSLQLEVARNTIKSLDCGDIPTITVFNKCDLIDTHEALQGVAVSAKTGFGLDKLIAEISKNLAERVVRCTVVLPFDKLSLIPLIREHGNVLEEQYKQDGVYIRATVDRSVYNRIEEFVTGV